MRWRRASALFRLVATWCHPSLGEQAAVGERLVDERSTLVDDLSGAEGVVADLGVAHVVVRREPDGRAVGADRPRRGS